MQYNELNLRLERREDGAYEALAWGATGEAAGMFKVPFSELEVENFVLHVGRTRRGTRRLESPEMQRAREFGGRLFDALFQSQVRDLYRDCYARARTDGKGLRVKLSLGRAPELTDLPWEYLYDSPTFLSISQFTPVVRYLDLPRARPPLAIEPPLRILAMISAPTGEVALDVEDERRKVELALQQRLLQRDLVEVTWLEQATLRALQRELRRGPYHVFHFIGHGAYDPALGESVLLLEDEDQRGRRVTGTQLGTILADHTSLRLAVLNACEGARTARDDPFSGVAAALVQHELPAVIAMQFEITDRAAIIFAEELYAALVEGLPVDAALAETRKAIYGDANDVEWGTPVLFMRVHDGRLFDLPKSSHEPGPAIVADLTPAVALEEGESTVGEPAGTEPVAQSQAERAEAERTAPDDPEAEEQARDLAEPWDAALPPREPGAEQLRQARWTRLQKVLPRRTRTRLLAVLLAALVVIGAVGGAVALTRGSGEPESVYGPEVTLTRLKDSTTSGTAQLARYDAQDRDTAWLSLDLSGGRSDRVQVVLFNDIDDVRTFTKLPAGARAVGGSLVPIFSGADPQGSVYETVDLPHDYRDFEFFGVVKAAAGSNARRLEVYAPMSRFPAL